MSWSSYAYIIFAGLSLLIGLLGYIWRDTMARIDTLEKRQTVSNEEVRIVIEDKLNPIKEDLMEIRSRLDSLLNRLIK